MSDDKESRPGPPPIEKASSFRLFDKAMVDRVVQGVKNLISPQRPAASSEPVNKQPWFGPGQPQAPLAPKEDVAGRQFDFPVGINTYTRPRSLEPISFDQLRAMADSWDLLRLAIETRKDQMAKLEWSVMPRKRPDESFRRKPDDRCREVEKFLRKPDKIHHFPDWVRMVVEDELVIGQPVLYRRTDKAGRPWALEPLDGATIQPIIDGSGRRPIPPDPAFVQILKGVPAAHYTSQELSVFPRNPRTHKAYGMGVVEQIIMTINIGLRRQTVQLESYTSGNVPDALISVPETWNGAQIAQFQRQWDSMMAQSDARRKAKFVPGGVIYQPTRGEGADMNAFDEWLARVVCYAMSLPPLPFVRMMNRATAQSSYESALEEGLQPMMTWLKNLLDETINEWFGYSDLELVWDNIKKLDPQDQAMQNLQFMQRGIKSLDEVRAEMGLEPLGLGHVMFGVGPMGFMSVQDMARTIKMGLTMPQPPMAPEMMGPDGMPMEQPVGAGMPPGQDLLAGVPPRLLESVGLDQNGSLRDEEDAADQGELVEGEAEETDDVPGAAHPEVAAALLDAERRLGAMR